MKNFFTVFVVVAITTFCRAQSPLPAVKLEDFATGLNKPTDIENAGDNRLFIVEKPGMIRICDLNGNVTAQPYLDISVKVKSSGDEQGLLGLAFHPNYASNGFFFVDYIDLNGNTVVSRFRVSNNPNLADTTSEELVLSIHQPWPNHNGGCLKFGPDGYLYISSGDGGREGDPLNTGQNTNSLLGKILRIDVNNGQPYSIPPSNPFVNVAGYAPEIWAYGLRNPWRMSFDRTKGSLWIGDVGQDSWEEVDLQRASSPGGENYGWSCTEGHHPYKNTNCPPAATITAPIAEYPHDGFDCTVIGGFVYRGVQFPNMIGKYIYLDYCSGRIRTIFPQGGQWKNELVGQEDIFSYTAFGEDVNGELYVANLEEGAIDHVEDTSGQSPQKAIVTNDEGGTILWPNPNHGQFTAQWISSGSETSEIEIVNMLGQQVRSEVAAASEGLNTRTFSNEQLLPGTYMLVVHTSSGLLRTKFSVE